MIDREALIRRLEKILEGRALEDARRDLEALQPGDTSHWLVQVLQAAERLPLHEVPPVLSQDLKDLMPTDELIGAYEAQVVADTRTSRPLAGVRGAHSAAGWSVSFTSEAADLVIDVIPDESGRLLVEGQVMAHGAASSAYRAAAVGPVTVETEGDRLGRFELGRLEPGRYELEVGNGRIQLSAVLDLEWGDR